MTVRSARNTEVFAFLLTDYGELGVSFDETELGFSRKECCARIAGQDHTGRPIAVFRANEGCFDDVTRDIAREALKLLIEGTWLFENGANNPHPLPDFIATHCADAQAILREAVGEMAAQCRNARPLTGPD